ncbi:MAG: hypothetical protein V4689_08920 [Verrucomicrobiota bacterium]
MKLSTALVLTVCAGAAAYLAGQWSQRETSPASVAAEIGRPASNARPRQPRGSRDPVTAVRALGKYASCSREYSAGNAARLTSEQRLELLANGAWADDYGNQEAMLCGLITVLTREEIHEAADILGSIQHQGNWQGPEVWKSLWQQWGRLDPEGCLKFFGPDAVSKTPVDARNVMTGWLETDADAALAWAWKPGKSSLESAAAALAISRNANGDLKQLESAMLKLPAGEGTAKVCMEDYFDLATLSGEDETPAAIYESINPELRPAAWSVTAKRLGYGDLDTAREWVTRHAHDPGRNYSGLTDLLQSLSHVDPAGTVRWAAQLPYSAASDPIHPASLPVERWAERDPEAALAWLKTQAPDAPWRLRVFPVRGNR